MSDEVQETGSAAVGGFQIPLGIKQRKQKIDDMLAQCPDINKLHVLLYLSSFDDGNSADAEKMLDDGDVTKFSEAITDHVTRQIVSGKMREIVRKKKGGGGYVLFSPNKGKKHPPKEVGTFPTKLGAKRAELARFPPKDAEKYKSMKKSVDNMSKSKEKYDKPDKKTEDVLRSAIRGVNEALFHDEKTGSSWDEGLARIPEKSLNGDKGFQKLQKAIEKSTESVLKDAFKAIVKATRSVADLKSDEVKQNAEKGKSYLPFRATLGETEVGPIFIYMENGLPKIELSDQAKASMTKVEPESLKKFRAELVMTQERVLDGMDGLAQAISKRDSYLDKLEDGLDKVVSGLSSLQVSLLKQLLVKKYRK